MHNYIVLLSDLSYELGLIGIAEYKEHRSIANWLSDELQSDPRCNFGDEREHPHDFGETREIKGSQFQSGVGSSNSGDDNSTDQWSCYLAFNRWVFTIGDRDCYPSVPHGHLWQKTNEWPKLNPYTGRVFSAVHAEDVNKRLTKSEMKILWNKSDFVEHCRKQVLWYCKFEPSYKFPNARSGKLRFPRW